MHGSQTSAEYALQRGQQAYARDILENQRRQTSLATQGVSQAQAAAVSQGANPFIAARQAGRQTTSIAGDIRAQTSQQLDARRRELETQRDREREAEQNRARQMIGSLLQTGGAVASMIPGIGSAIGGAAGAVGGMVSGQPQQGGGGIGGAIGGLMNSFGGGGQPQQAPMQRVPMATPQAPAQGGGANGMWNGPPAQLVGPAFGMQGAGTSAVNQAAGGPLMQPNNALAEQLRQRREELFAPTGQGGAWWRNGQ